MAQGAGTVLTGGSGADQFVFAAVTGRMVVSDFRPGEDQLDLSMIPGLYGPGQLQITERGDGLELAFGETEIRVHSAAGTALTLQDIWPDGRFSTPDRVALAPPQEDGLQYGGSGADHLEGGQRRISSRVWTAMMYCLALVAPIICWAKRGWTLWTGAPETTR